MAEHPLTSGAQSAVKKIDWVSRTLNFLTIGFLAYSGIRAAIETYKNLPKFLLQSKVESALDGYLDDKSVKNLSDWTGKIYDFYFNEYKNFILNNVSDDMEDKLHTFIERYMEKYLYILRLHSHLADDEEFVIETIDNVVLYPLFKIRYYEFENHHRYNDLSIRVISNIINNA